MIYKRIGHWHLDVTISGIRYREALNTTDKRLAKEREKDRIAEIKQGKRASKTGREFARKPFTDAAAVHREERKPHVAERTLQVERERLVPLCKYFGDKPLIRIKADDISAYQTERLNAGISPVTINMEVSVVRSMLRRAKAWNSIAEDVRMLPERRKTVGRALPADLKQKLFETAASRPEWMVAHCAAVLAVSTTARGIEVKHLQWQDVDFFSRVMTIRRSKTDAGLRSIPLNGDAMAALARLLERARALGTSEPHHYIFPACENGTRKAVDPAHVRGIDPTRPQKSFRTAWRKFVRETARKAGREAAASALCGSHSLRKAITAWKAGAAPYRGLRFHDLRHQAITEIAEAGASDATLMSVSGHLTPRMVQHYSHVRMAAKRTALDKLESGLMGGLPVEKPSSIGKAN